MLTAAIVTTALTGGAAASLWIPFLVTLGAGVLAMGATAAIKGSRYSRDQVLTDLATHIVSAATAGIASAATAGIRGAMAGGMTGGKAAISALAGNMRVSERALGLVSRGMLAVDDLPAFMALGASLGDDAVRLGLTSADDLAALAARGAGGADDIVNAATRSSGVVDDLAGAATRAGGVADEAAAATAQVANASDDAIAVAARAAGVSDDAMRQIMLDPPPWFVNALIGGVSSAAGSAAGTAADLNTRRSEKYWKKWGWRPCAGLSADLSAGRRAKGCSAAQDHCWATAVQPVIFWAARWAAALADQPARPPKCCSKLVQRGGAMALASLRARCCSLGCSPPSRVQAKAWLTTGGGRVYPAMRMNMHGWNGRECCVEVCRKRERS